MALTTDAPEETQKLVEKIASLQGQVDSKEKLMSDMKEKAKKYVASLKQDKSSLERRVAAWLCVEPCGGAVVTLLLCVVVGHPQGGTAHVVVCRRRSQHRIRCSYLSGGSVIRRQDVLRRCRSTGYARERAPKELLPLIRGPSQVR